MPRPMFTKTQSSSYHVAQRALSSPYPSRHHLVRDNESLRPQKANSTPQPASFRSSHLVPFHLSQYNISAQQLPFVMTPSLPKSTSGENFQVDPTAAHNQDHSISRSVPYNQFLPPRCQDDINIEPIASTAPMEPLYCLQGPFTAEPVQETPALDTIIDSSSGQASLTGNISSISDFNRSFDQASLGSSMPSISDFNFSPGQVSLKSSMSSSIDFNIPSRQTSLASNMPSISDFNFSPGQVSLESSMSSSIDFNIPSRQTSLASNMPSVSDFNFSPGQVSLESSMSSSIDFNIPSRQTSLASNMPSISDFNFSPGQISLESNISSSRKYCGIHLGPRAEFGMETFHRGPGHWMGAPQPYHPTIEDSGLPGMAVLSHDNQLVRRHTVSSDSLVPDKNENGEYLCKICSKPFRTKGNRDRHERTVHGEKERTRCEACDKCYSRKDAKMAHDRKKHNERADSKNN